MSTILIFNGASSSGKSTFIKQLIPELHKPFFYYSSDKLVDAKILPEVDRENTNLANSWNISPLRECAHKKAHQAKS